MRAISVAGAVEPWYTKYWLLADRGALLLTPVVQLETWQGQEVGGTAGRALRLRNIFQRYIDNIDKK